MKLQLKFNVERRLGDPLIKIVIDDYLLLYNDIAEDFLEFDVPLDNGNHELKITHYDKTVHDHIVDKDGTIVVDKHVEIVEIWLEGVALDHELLTGQFFPVYLETTAPRTYSTPNTLYLGHNGTWILKFVTPAVKWLIDNRHLGPKLDNTIFKTTDTVLAEVKNIFKDLPDV